MSALESKCCIIEYLLLQVWDRVRSYAQWKLYQRLKIYAEGFAEPPGFVYKDTSVGVSYVVPSESLQVGCESYEPLPPVTIRPNCDISHREYTIKGNLKTLEEADTLASVFPVCDEQIAKEYLLSSDDRRGMIDSHNGKLIFGGKLRNLLDEAFDKSFLCWHYCLERTEDGGCVLLPVQDDDLSLRQSDVQLAITIRKGVGGTAGMKSEARNLDKGALLGLLLGEDPHSLLKYYSAINKLENDSNKVLKEEEIEDSPIPAEKKMALVTLCCRVDMYISRQIWGQLDEQDINQLACSAKGFGKLVSKALRQKSWESYLEHLNSLQFEMPGGSLRPIDPVCQQVDALLDATLASLDPGKEGKSISMQQSFLKMYVCCLSLSTSQKKGHNHLPFYMVSTRDCFSSDIVGEDTIHVSSSGRRFLKTRWFIHNKDVPSHFDTTIESLPGSNMAAMIVDGIVSTIAVGNYSSADSNPKKYLLPLGITTYNNVYSSKQLDEIESNCDDLHGSSLKGILPKECYHETASKKGQLKRTKYFFGSRYLWSKEQLKSPFAKVAGGIRHDVPKPPSWMTSMVEQPLVNAEIAQKDFVDAIALNMYHDGSEGIQSHYDDSKRFQQPIYSLRLFSDSRLSFGTQLYGFNNGLFFIPMPRGCITVMENAGFAANGVKHCVRPIDMTGKSAAMILRKINEEALVIAEELFWKESLDKLRHMTLSPTNPDRLIWNPLFDECDINFDQSHRKIRVSSKKPRSQNREKRCVELVMECMLRHVCIQSKKEDQANKKVLYIMSGMTKRVCTAERIGFNLRHDDDCNVFRVMDDMVSFCEFPGIHLRRGVKRKRDPVRQQVKTLLREIVLQVEQEYQQQHAI